jgi:hypothetical protein
MSDLVPRRRVLSQVFLLLAYLAVAAGTTWPLVAHLATHIPGHTLDAPLHYWNGWWVRRALTTDQSLFHTPLLFYPQGVSLVHHNFAWFNALGWMALEPIAGGLVAYNLIFLLLLGLCGFGANLLTHHLTGNRRAAFLAGLVYQCWPFRMAQLDHPNLVATFCIPLFLLFVTRLSSHWRWRDAILTGVFFAMVGYTRWQLLIPAGIVGGIQATAVHLADRQARAPRTRWVGQLLLAGSIVVLAWSPPLWVLLNERATAPVDLLRQEDEATIQTDLLAYLTPSPRHPVFGGLTSRLYGRYYHDRAGGRRFPAYMGVITLVLTFLGLLRAPRESAPWLLSAAVLVSLALGLDLRVNGELYPAVPMPYRLASQSFLVRLMRFPDRFSLFLALPMAVMAAYGTRQLLVDVDKRDQRLATATTCLLTLGVAFDYLAVPVPLYEARLSSYHHSLAGESSDFAVLNLPIDPQASKQYMFEQTVHQHPVLQGHVSRLSQQAYATIDSQPFLRSLRQSGEMDPALADVGRQLASLAAADVRDIIIHKEGATPDRLKRWERYLLISPRFEDGVIAVFPTSPEIGRDFSLMQELAAGLGPVRVITSTGCVNPGGVLEVDVGWGAVEPPGQDFDVELALVASDGRVAQVHRYPVCTSSGAPWLTHDWSEGAVAWGYYPLYADPVLPPAAYEVRLVLVDSQSGRSQGNPMIVGDVTISRSPCDLPTPSDAVRSNTVFGDELRLLGHGLQRDDDRLMVSLHWRSEQRMETDYKVFVHVFDLVTSVPVAQDDAMPLRWSYPTSFWGPGEYVRDDIPIDLNGVPQGHYGIAIGIYDPHTLERLPVVDVRHQVSPDGRLVLPGEIVVVEEGA